MISKRKDRLAKFFRPLAKMLEKTHLSPNAITLLGFLLTFLVIPFAVSSNYSLAGIIVIAAGLFDALDGALARLTNRVTIRGGFIDSVLDRYSDAIIIIAIIFANLCNTVWGFVALVGSLLVSYSRARVEAFGVKRFVVGFAERPVRLLLIALAFFLENWYPKTLNYTIIALAVLTHLTVLERSILAKDALSKINQEREKHHRNKAKTKHQITV